MTIYTGNISTIKLHKFIKKIRTHLLESSSIDTPVIEIYVVGNNQHIMENGVPASLTTLTNYLLQIKEKCMITLTFRGYIDGATAKLFFTPFKKWVSKEVLDQYANINLRLDDLYHDNNLQSYKKLVEFTTDITEKEIPLLDLPNINLI